MGRFGGDMEEEEESADNRGFTRAPWANPVPGGGYQGARDPVGVCDQKPFGEDLPALPGALGAAVPSHLTRPAQTETEIIK